MVTTKILNFSSADFALVKTIDFISIGYSGPLLLAYSLQKPRVLKILTIYMLLYLKDNITHLGMNVD